MARRRVERVRANVALEHTGRIEGAQVLYLEGSKGRNRTTGNVAIDKVVLGSDRLVGKGSKVFEPIVVLLLCPQAV